MVKNPVLVEGDSRPTNCRKIDQREKDQRGNVNHIKKIFTLRLDKGRIIEE